MAKFLLPSGVSGQTIVLRKGDTPCTQRSVQGHEVEMPPMPDGHKFKLVVQGKHHSTWRWNDRRGRFYRCVSKYA